MSAALLPASLRELGLLRLVLLAAVGVAIVLVPEPGTRAIYSGWPMVTTVLIPVLAPLLFMVLLLDALMARLFLTSTEGPDRARYRKIIFLNLLAAAVLVIRWLPYYAALRV